MRDPRGEYHEGREHENERSVVLGRRVLRVKKEEKENGEVHAGHLEGNAARVVDGFLHGVTGNAALDELVLAELADLED